MQSGLVSAENTCAAVDSLVQIRFRNPDRTKSVGQDEIFLLAALQSPALSVERLQACYSVHAI